MWRMGLWGLLVLLSCAAPLALQNQDGSLVPDARERVSPLVLGTEVVLVSHTGEVVAGTLLRLTDQDLFLRTPEGDTVRIQKSTIRCVGAEISRRHQVPTLPANPLLFYAGGGLGTLLISLFAGSDIEMWKTMVPYFSGMLMMLFGTDPGPSSGRQVWTISSGRASPFRAYKPGFYAEGSWCRERISSAGFGEMIR